MMFLFMVLTTFAAVAEVRFNALDAADPGYSVYQANLCAATRADALRLAAYKTALDTLDPMLAGKSPDEREDWAVDYVVTKALSERFRAEYGDHCQDTAHVD